MQDTNIKNICIFCGSSAGENPEFAEMTKKIAKDLLSRKINVLYGAGSVGLMGILADEILAGGGKLTGIVPRFLDAKEVVHRNLSELILVDSMAERKKILMERADAFLVLPGGFGTLDELFEVLTAVQLGLMNKAVGILNTANYFSALIAFFENAVKERFLKEEHSKALIVDENPAKLLDKMSAYKHLEPENWIENLIRNNKY